MQGRGRREKLWRMPRLISWIFPSPAWLERLGEPGGGAGCWEEICPHPLSNCWHSFIMSVCAPETWKAHFQDTPTVSNTLGAATIWRNFFIKCPSINPLPRKWSTAWNQQTAFSTNNEHCGEQVLYLNDCPPAFCQVCFSRRPTLLGWGLLPLWPSGLGKGIGPCLFNTHV